MLVPYDEEGYMTIKIANEDHIAGIVSVWKNYIDYISQLDPFFTRKDDDSSRIAVGSVAVGRCR